jgi:opacity protein-like surface antigen
MKRIYLAFCCIIVLTSALYCQEDSVATPPPHPVVYFFGGLSHPNVPSEFKAYWKNGWHLGGGYGYSFSPGPLGYIEIYGTVEYTRFAFNDSSYRGELLKQYSAPIYGMTRAVWLARGSAKAIDAMLNLKCSFSSTKHSIAPYFLFGIGYFHFSSDSSSMSATVNHVTTLYTLPEVNQSAFGWTFGLGVEFPFSEAATFFVEGKSVLGVLEQERQYFPISGGFRITL